MWLLKFEAFIFADVFKIVALWNMDTRKGCIYRTSL